MLCLWAGAAPAAAQEGGQSVGEVRFRGAVRTTEAYLRSVVRTRPGEPFDQGVVDADIARLLGTGRFLTATATTEPGVAGLVVIFDLGERPTIAAIQFAGNKAIKDAKLAEEVPLKAGDPSDAYGVREGRDNILRAYRDKGYGHATVEVDEDRLRDTGVLEYQIEEGPKVRVRKVLFEGNQAFEAKELRRLIQTKAALWIIRAGLFDEEQLAADAAEIQTHYRREGYLDARVSYRVDPGREPGDLEITFTIVEGTAYRIESIRLEGHTVLTTEDIQGMMRSAPEQVVRQALLDADQEAVQTAYQERGYIYATARAIRVFSETPGYVLLTLQIVEGDQFHVGRIVARGNAGTQDKVVRRELELYPGDVFNLTKAREAEKSLRALQIFDRATVTPLGDAPGVRDIVIDVEESERGLGDLLFAVGVTSNSGIVGSIMLDVKNFDIFDTPRSFSEFIKGRSFRGAGQRLRIELQPGTELNRFRIDFTEPYLFDKPIRFGTGLYLFNRGREAYDERRAGGNVSFGRRLENGLGPWGWFTDWYGEVAFRAENVNISDVDIFDDRSVRDVEGDSILTSVKGTLVRDRTDSRFLPTEGDRVSVSYEQFVGDFNFGKVRASYTRHHTLATDRQNRKTVLSWNAEAGAIAGDAPVYERFYAGGIGSIRGFDFRGVGPRGGLIDRDPIGGDFSLTTNVEYTFPLYGELLRGVLFTDMGTVEEDFTISQWRASVGFGFRMTIQFFGPLPLEFDFAIPVLSDDEDDEQVFSFYIGATF